MQSDNNHNLPLYNTYGIQLHNHIIIVEYLTNRAMVDPQLSSHLQWLLIFMSFLPDHSIIRFDQPIVIHS